MKLESSDHPYSTTVGRIGSLCPKNYAVVTCKVSVQETFTFTLSYYEFQVKCACKSILYAGQTKHLSKDRFSMPVLVHYSHLIYLSRNFHSYSFINIFYPKSIYTYKCMHVCICICIYTIKTFEET